MAGSSGWRRTVGAATIGALVGAVMVATSPGAVAAPVPPATGNTVTAPGGAGPARTDVTLVTGDVVTVAIESGGSFTAEVTRPAPRPGRTVLFSTVRESDSLYVYPSDALDLVTAGRLDRRLFDVRYLATNGYADKASPTLPLIVQYPRPGVAADLLRRADALPAGDATVPLVSVGGAAVRVEKARAADFWAGIRDGGTTLRQGLAKVWLDAKVHADLAESVPMIGAPQAWAAGYDGTGVKVAVLDTGIDATHADLAGKVAAAQTFVPGDSARDGHGHGTHVASTIVGSGAASGGRFKGVAPGASLLVGKVLDDTGWGSDSQIIAGMQWAAQQGADIVSMSLGGGSTDGTDPMSQAVNTLSAQSGALFVIAAGNDGRNGAMTINTPGAADSALTVAAVDNRDALADFSSRGPRLGDFGLKPDISAPGVAITAARAAGTEIGPIVDGKYTTISGTSMATPHVAGAAAILAQEHPDWRGARLKSTLMSTAKDDGYGPYEQGSGRVDVARAVRQGVSGTGGVDFGKIPYEQTAPVSRTVTYTNDTDAPVTLRLSASITAHRGTVPAGALRLDRDAVTVPAHGVAPVTVSFNPAGAPQTWFEGAVRATAGDVAVTTSLGGFRDLRRVTFTGTIVAPDGATDISYEGWQVLMLDDRDEVEVIGQSSAGAQVSAQFYAGHYLVRAFVRWRDRDGAPNNALVVATDTDLTRDATVRFDLRKAQRLSTALPKPGEPYVQQFGFVSTAAGGRASLRNEVKMYGGNRLWTLPTGAKPSLGDFYAYNQRIYTAPRLTMRVSGRVGTLDARYPAPNVLVDDDRITRFTGHRGLAIVDGGHGTPADLAGRDVRGKLVLLDLSDICATTCTDQATDRVAAVAAAGGAGVLGFGSVGRGFLDPDPNEAQGTWPVYPVPTVSLAADQGRRLRAALAGGSLRVDVTGSATPSYVYALAYPWIGAIPARPGGTVGGDDVFRVVDRLHADAPGVAALNFTAQLPLGKDYRVGDPIKWVGNGNSLPVRAPNTVTTYFGPVRRDLGWLHGAILTYDAPDDVDGYHRNGWADSTTDEFTRSGSRVEDLGEQPLASNTTLPSAVAARYTIPTCLSCRNGDMLNPVHVLDNNGRGSGYQAYDITNGAYGDEQTDLHLFADGRELPVQTGIAWIAPPWFAYYNPYFTLPPQAARYRLTERYTADWPMQRFARTVDTAWTFASKRPTGGYTEPEQGANCMGWYITYPKPRDACRPTGQLFLGYDLGLGLDNTLRAGRPSWATFSAYHSSLLSPAPRVTGLEVSTSTDGGAHWSKAPVVPLGGGKFRVLLTNPRGAGAISLRSKAADAAGNTVEQTIQHAYGLR
jgi:subtilisin family serine protease